MSLTEGLRITRVVPGSPAHRAGLDAGDRILAIEGYPAIDYLDLFFHEDSESIEMVIETAEENRRKITIRKEPDVATGIEVPDLQIRRCRNRCIFCFSDQNPPGLRKSLYFKDEDYRFSFLFGHYVTLSDVTDETLERIIRLRLHPLYISIHATDERVRGRLLGRRNIRPILLVLKELSDAGITFHGQIVICPGINDGVVLEQTIDDLKTVRPALQSLALIPVGLTRHRNGLPRLKPVEKPAAERIYDVWFRYRKRLSMDWLMISDELVLRAEKPIPPSDVYGDYPQIENGVGMIRRFLDEADEYPPIDVDRLLEKPVYWITGTDAAPYLESVLDRWLIRTSLRASVKVIPIQNRFFGSSVTVAGLIAGCDILDALRSEIRPAGVVIPSVMLDRSETVFLDDLALRDLSRRLGCPVKCVDPDADSAYKMLSNPVQWFESADKNR